MLNKSQSTQIFKKFLKNKSFVLGQFQDKYIHQGNADKMISSNNFGVYLQGKQVGVPSAYCGIFYQGSQIFFVAWEGFRYKSELRIALIKKIFSLDSRLKLWVDGVLWTSADSVVWNHAKKCQIIIENCDNKDSVEKALNQMIPLFVYFCSSVKAERILEMQEDCMPVNCNFYVDFLKANHNIILHGAPGTGKTYLAKEIAKAMNAEYKMVQFHQSYDYTDLVEGLRPIEDDDGKIGFERQDGSFKTFCKKALGEDKKHYVGFSKAYKDFIANVKSTGLTLSTLVRNKNFSIKVNNNDNLYAIPNTETATQMPITKELLQDYIELGKIRDWKPYVTAIGAYLKEKYKNQLGEIKKENIVGKKDFVFIIDEINRGEMSKIFGELFFSIDPGYRGEKGRIDTQYQNLVEEEDVFADGFYVPENVYIIGTMNDIDRSVESMDFAMRRRFAFKEIKANDRIAMLDDLKCGKKDDAIKRMKVLNAAIEKVEGLSSAYDIGPAYFLKLDNYGGDFDQLWEYHIEGVLREYLRGMEDAEETLAALHKAYNLEKA